MNLKDDLSKIIDIQIERIKERLKEKSLTIIIKEEVKYWLIEKGYDPIYGARPLKRIIQKEIETSIAKAILKDKISSNKEINVVLRNNTIDVS